MMASERSKWIQVRATPAEKHDFQRAADMYGISVSALVRGTIEFLLTNKPTLPIKAKEVGPATQE